MVVVGTEQQKERRAERWLGLVSSYCSGLLNKSERRLLFYSTATAAVVDVDEILQYMPGCVENIIGLTLDIVLHSISQSGLTAPYCTTLSKT